MGKKAKPRSPRIYSELQLSGIRHSNTIRRLVTLERLFQQYMRIERARHDPGGRTRLEELDDHDTFFLTRTGKPYSLSTYCHHCNRLFALAQSQIKRKMLWNSLLVISDIYASPTVTKILKDAHGNASVASAQLERFRHIMKWRSPETMQPYIKMMNKRQAMKPVLDDEGAQGQDEAIAQVAYSKWIETPSPGNSPIETSSARDDDDEFDRCTH